MHFRAGCRDARVDVLIGWEVWVVRQRRACGGRAGPLHGGGGGCLVVAPPCTPLQSSGKHGREVVAEWVFVAVCARREVREGSDFRAAGRRSLGRGCTSLQALQGSGKHGGMGGWAVVAVGFSGGVSSAGVWAGSHVRPVAAGWGCPPLHLHIGGSGSGEGVDRGFVGGAYFEAAAVVFARGGSDGTETVSATSGGGTDGGRRDFRGLGPCAHSPRHLRLLGTRRSPTS